MAGLETLSTPASARASLRILIAALTPVVPCGRRSRADAVRSLIGPNDPRRADPEDHDQKGAAEFTRRAATVEIPGSLTWPARWLLHGDGSAAGRRRRSRPEW